MSEVPHIQGLATDALNISNQQLETPTEAVTEALEGTDGFEGFIESFECNVMRFTIEAEVRDHIRRRLSERYDGTVDIHGSVLSAPREYKLPYARGVCRPTTTDAVRSEVNIGNSSKFGGVERDEDALCDFESDGSQSVNKRLDIAILKDTGHPHPVFEHHPRVFDGSTIGSSSDGDRSIEVAIAGGSKYFPPESIAVAIEVKYVKDKPTASLDKGMWKKVATDVEKLAELRNTCRRADTTPPEAHLILVTNYDPFRLRPHHELDEEKEEPRENVKNGSSYPSRFRKMAETCAENGIHVWAYAPEKLYKQDT